MKLYYTGAPKQGQPQPLSKLSVGGYISSTEISSNTIGNLFSDISIVNRQQYSIRCIALKNDSGSAITALTSWFDFAQEGVNYEFGLILPATDACGLFFEQILSESQNPSNISWYEADGFVNRVTANVSIANQEYIGIWIRRTIDVSATAVSCDSLNTSFNSNVPLNEIFEFDLTIQSSP